MDPEEQNQGQGAAVEEAAPSRSDIIAEMATLGEDGQPQLSANDAPAPEAEAPAPEQPAPEEQKAAEVEQEDADDDLDLDDDLDMEDAELDAEAKVEAKAKAIAERLFDQKMAEWERRQGRQEEQKSQQASDPDLDALKNRVHYDPAGVLAALGYDLDKRGDFAAQQSYALSGKAAEDPKNRQVAERMRHIHEANQRATAAEKRAQALEQKFEQYVQQQQAEQGVQRYLGSVKKAIGDSTPLVKTLLDEAPDIANQALRETALEILEKTGKEPKPEQVVKRLERKRLQERRRIAKLYGFELPSSTPTATPPPAATSTPAGKSEPQPNDVNPSPAAALTEEELDPDALRDQILRDMQAGKISL